MNSFAENITEVHYGFFYQMSPPEYAAKLCNVSNSAMNQLRRELQFHLHEGECM